MEVLSGSSGAGREDVLSPTPDHAQVFAGRIDLVERYAADFQFGCQEAQCGFDRSVALLRLESLANCFRECGRIFGELVTTYKARGNLIPDAGLAALAIEHGVVLVSTDTDVARFRELRWENPLQ